MFCINSGTFTYYIIMYRPRDLQNNIYIHVTATKYVYQTTNILSTVTNLLKISKYVLNTCSVSTYYYKVGRCI